MNGVVLESTVGIRVTSYLGDGMETIKRKLPFTFPALGENRQQNDDLDDLGTVVERPPDGQLGILFPKLRDPTVPESVPCRQFTPSTKAGELRPIVIDGGNIARSHGRPQRMYSAKGIQICINYFHRRGHKVVVVCSGSRRISRTWNRFPEESKRLLEKLHDEGLVIFTPTTRLITGKLISIYDDRLILSKAVEGGGGIVVSNDRYRDLYPEKEAYRDVIDNRILRYRFSGDIFIPFSFPFGPSGPTLNQFLRVDGGALANGLRSSLHSQQPLQHPAAKRRKIDTTQHYRDSDKANQQAIFDEESISELLTLHPDAEFVVVGIAGSSEFPLFTMRVTVNDMVYEGSGPSKEEAQKAAARNALIEKGGRPKEAVSKTVKSRGSSRDEESISELLTLHPDAEFVVVGIAGSSEFPLFTMRVTVNDMVYEGSGPSKEEAQKAAARNALIEKGGRPKEAVSKTVKSRGSSRDEESISELLTLHPDAEFVVVGIAGSSEFPLFTMRVTVNDMVYEGSGPSKEEAQKAAARNALIEKGGRPKEAVSKTVKSRGSSRDEESISELLTLHPDAEFVVVGIAGSSEFPLFTMRVTVNDMVYEGSGPSKEEAQKAAARNALIEKGGRPKEAVSKTVKSRGSSRDEESISELLTLHPDAEFVVVGIAGSSEFPLFTMRVTVNDMVYEGSGPSKEEAQQAAARNALIQKGGRPKEAVSKTVKSRGSSRDEKPISNLHKLHPDAEFVVVGIAGSSQFPLFTMRVTVNDMVYEGSGPSKEEAQQAAARNALVQKGGRPKEAVSKTVKSRGSSRDEKPISNLHKLHPDAEFVVVGIAGSSQFPLFTMRVTVNDMVYEGSGPSKEEAQQAAARKALIQKGGRPKEAVSKTVKSRGSSRDEESISELLTLHPDAEFVVVGIAGSSEFPLFTMRVTVNDMVYEGSGPSEEEAQQAAARNALIQKGGRPKEAVSKTVKSRGSSRDEESISELLTLHPDAEFVVVCIAGSSEFPLFTMRVTVNDMVYEGSGPSKEEAQQAAARNALVQKGGRPKEAVSKTVKSRGSSRDEESISELLTLHPDAEFVVVGIAGSSEFPLFTMRVTVNDMVYEGSGPSKEEAQQAAARNALIQKGGRPKEAVSKTVKSRGSSRDEESISELLTLHPDAEFVVVGIAGSSEFPLFTMRVTVNDMVYEGSGPSKEEAQQAAARNALIQKGGRPKEAVSKTVKSRRSSRDEKPISNLRKLHPDAEFVVVCIKGSSQFPLFTMRVTVKDMVYEGRGSTKKEAKQAAARKALKQKGGFSKPVVKKPEKLSKFNPNDWPVRRLRSLHSDVKFTPARTPALSFWHIMRVTVIGMTFEGSGPTWREATEAAARNALKELMGGKPTEEVITMESDSHRPGQKQGRQQSK